MSWNPAQTCGHMVHQSYCILVSCELLSLIVNLQSCSLYYSMIFIYLSVVSHTVPVSPGGPTLPGLPGAPFSPFSPISPVKHTHTHTSHYTTIYFILYITNGICALIQHSSSPLQQPFALESFTVIDTFSQSYWHYPHTSPSISIMVELSHKLILKTWDMLLVMIYCSAVCCHVMQHTFKSRNKDLYWAGFLCYVLPMSWLQ